LGKRKTRPSVALAGPSYARLNTAKKVTSTWWAHHGPERCQKKAKKRHRAFHQEVVSLLAEVVKNEADFAIDSGTVPRQEVSVWVTRGFVSESWEKEGGN
jgi:hypothetical protein